MVSEPLDFSGVVLHVVFCFPPLKIARLILQELEHKGFYSLPNGFWDGKNPIGAGDHCLWKGVPNNSKKKVTFFHGLIHGVQGEFVNISSDAIRAHHFLHKSCIQPDTFKEYWVAPGRAVDRVRKRLGNPHCRWMPVSRFGLQPCPIGWPKPANPEQRQSWPCCIADLPYFLGARLSAAICITDCLTYTIHCHVQVVVVIRSRKALRKTWPNSSAPNAIWSRRTWSVISIISLSNIPRQTDSMSFSLTCIAVLDFDLGKLMTAPEFSSPRLFCVLESLNRHVGLPSVSLAAF